MLKFSDYAIVESYKVETDDDGGKMILCKNHDEFVIHSELISD